MTVVGSGRRLDADLPESIAVADVLADLVALLGESSNGAAVEWGLLKVGGGRLDPELSLADQGVADGTMLFLRDVTGAPPAPAIDDFVGRVAAIVDAQPGRWGAQTPAALLAWVAAGSLAAAGLSLLAIGDAPSRAVAGIAGLLVASAAAFLVARVAGRPFLGEVLMFSGLPAWVGAGVGVAGLAGATPTLQAASGLAAASIGAVAAFVVLPERAFVAMTFVVEATAIPAVAIGVTGALGGGPVQAAGLLVVVEVLFRTAMRAVSRWLIADADGPALVRKLDQGRRAEAASHIASALVITGSCAVLAVSEGWTARSLVVAAALATALSARHFRFTAEVAPLVAAGLVSLLLLEVPFAVWLAIGVRAAAGLAGLLIADAIVLVAAATLVRRWSLSARALRWLRPLEFVAVAATLPLALGVLGFFDAVAREARGLV